MERVARSVRIVFGLAALVFVALAARSLASRWDGSKLSFSVPFGALSLVPLLVGASVLAWGWKKLLERMVGRRVPGRIAIAVHLESQLARYTPGKVGMPLVRMAGAPRLGPQARLIGVSVFVETLSLMAVGGVVSFTALLSTSNLAGRSASLLGTWGIPILCGFVGGTLVLLAVDRRHIPAALRRFVDDGGRGPIVPLRLPLLHALYWLTWTVHGYFVSRAVGASHAAALASSGLYALAPILGFLALVAPGGIGVREAVLAMGLAPTVGPAPALGAALASRGLSIVSDVLSWLISRSFARS